jgi:hypothetical protein
MMSDEADLGNEQMEKDLAAALRAARKDLKKGYRGDCDMCGRETGRLIEGVCAPCRDRYGLP